MCAPKRNALLMFIGELHWGPRDVQCQLSIRAITVLRCSLERCTLDKNVFRHVPISLMSDDEF